MEMNNSEIVRSYRDAKNKKEQVRILAELNACSVPEIIGILREAGVDPRELPRKRKNARPSDEEILESVDAGKKCKEEEQKAVEKHEEKPAMTEEPESVVLIKAVGACRKIRPDVYCGVLRAYEAAMEEQNERYRELIEQNESQIGIVERMIEETGWTE